MSLGVDDYCLEMGIEPSPEGTELFLAFTLLATVCKASGLKPMGVLGSVADFTDLAVFEHAALRARQLGFTGAFCIHPQQVDVLNRVFSPGPEKVRHAGRVGLESGVESRRQYPLSGSRPGHRPCPGGGRSAGEADEPRL